MAFFDETDSHIFLLPGLLKRIEFWRQLGDKLVFTNGCFDIIHPGHVHLLASCANLADHLIVGLNSDASVNRLKGRSRPVNDQLSRARVLASIKYVDAVVIFDEDTPEKLIHEIKPDILVKGGDWQKSKIAGSAFVEGYGGKVLTIPYLEGHSTTEIIKRSVK